MVRNGLRTGVKTGLRTQLRVDPRLVLGSHLLEVSQIELEQAIESELQENPALERIDDFEEPVTFDEIVSSIAPRDRTQHIDDHEQVRSAPQDASYELDWTDLAGTNDSLLDHLLGQLRVGLPERLWPLVTYFVGSINDRGYLTCTVEEAALDCDALLDDAETVLMALKACEPAGVGAADLRECLWLQIRNPQTDSEKLARAMLKNNWDDVVSRDSKAIMRAYGVELELVDAAFDVILRLSPFPGEAFAHGHRLHKGTEPASVSPDVVLKLDVSGWLVEVPGPNALSLRIDPAYSRRRAELMGKAWNDPERRHVMEFSQRAEQFIEAISDRRRTLARVGKHLVECQTGFVQTGEYRFLGELTRTQVARDLGMHESTISRATNGKFVQIATGDVVSFDVFFKPALKVQKLIEEILSHENPDDPLSDEAISKMLASQGIKVARRTVNKYRDRTRLLSSRLRRSA
ncbi:MAG: RNA polymerase factor sigma-54 [Armatimonadetes bacterium]|nr:RNA polymerase factor sigma-54 [Armatimonadota bacterium]